MCLGIQINFYAECKKNIHLFLYLDVYGLRIGSLQKKENWIKNVYEPMYDKNPVIEWL